MERVCMYLRKSRADLEAEARGEGETLAKHRSILLKVAKERGLNIVRIREEIVSGESLMARPQMLQLLQEVEAGEYDAVLVMDMDRLGRGNMQEQGLILDTFKRSKTKIITPRKVYDLEDEFDEEYSEFEAFMARKELKIITRRLQRGRIRSVEEGHYLGNRPPYGYMLKKENGRQTLEPHPEQADVVRMIYDLYVNEGLGTSRICDRLEELGIPTVKGGPWSTHTVIGILRNPVYIGKIRWNARPQVKNKDGTRSRPREKEKVILADGLHPPIIDEETFRKAQERMNSRRQVPSPTGVIKFPLAGLIRCGICGAAMVQRPYPDGKTPTVICSNRYCTNVSSYSPLVEERVLSSLREWLDQYKLDWSAHQKPQKAAGNAKMKERVLASLQRELNELEGQKGRLHDLLERGIYDVDTYLERSQNLAERIESTRQAITLVEEELLQEQRREQAQKEIIPAVENVLDLYHQTDDPAKKNALLKSVLHRVEYRKEKRGDRMGRNMDEFEVILYPKV